MSIVTIRKVDNYNDSPGIRSFVREMLESSGHAEFLSQGDSSKLVVVKPNWIQESHEYEPDIWEPVITNPSLVLAVVEEVARIMGGRGTVCVCDAPHAYADFDGITARGSFRERWTEAGRRWPGLQLELLDLRREISIRKEEVVVERRKNSDDPRGYARLNLGADSGLYGHRGEGRYYGADYDTSVVNSHHCGDRHEYLLSGTAIACDLFINLPKLKTHKKTGITCCLKNLVGINGDKNWLPHHTEGFPDAGGDEFPHRSLGGRLEGSLKRLGRRCALGLPLLGPWMFRKMRNVGKSILGESGEVIRNGNWMGNDTCWRMVLDLNRALLFGNTDGSMRGADRPKRYLAIVDGILGGEGNGPLCPKPVPSKVLIAGTDPAAVDAAAARAMGYDPAHLPVVAGAFARHRWPINTCRMDEIRIQDRSNGTLCHLGDMRPAVEQGFEPHFGWKALRAEDMRRSNE